VRPRLVRTPLRPVPAAARRRPGLAGHTVPTRSPSRCTPGALGGAWWRRVRHRLRRRPRRTRHRARSPPRPSPSLLVAGSRRSSPAGVLVVACSWRWGGGHRPPSQDSSPQAPWRVAPLTACCWRGRCRARPLHLYGARGGAAARGDRGCRDPGVGRVAVASALELGPALWRYREVATGTRRVLHAAAWRHSASCWRVAWCGTAGASQ